MATLPPFSRRWALAVRPYINRAGNGTNNQVLCPSLAWSCQLSFFAQLTMKLARDGHQTSREAPRFAVFLNLSPSVARFAMEQLAKAPPTSNCLILSSLLNRAGRPVGSPVPTPALPVPFLLRTAVRKQRRVCVSRLGPSLNARFGGSRSAK